MTENKQQSDFGRKFWKNLGRSSSVAVSLYAAGICLYLLLRIFIGYQLWPLAFFSIFLHWLLLPALTLLPIMLWRRRWPTAGMLTPGVIAFAWLFGGLFLPPSTIPTAQAGSGHTLTVMTFNTNADVTAPEKLIPVLRGSGADIIALQEVGAALATALDDSLLDEYPNRAYISYGSGLLSRYPILEYEMVENGTAFPYLIATLSVDGQKLTVISAHLPPPILAGRRGYKSQAIEEIPHFVDLATGSEPTILMGDFNTTDQSADYGLLANAELHDSFREAGWGFGSTWPARRVAPLVGNPIIRIDYIWHTEHFTTQRAWVGPGTGSDHRPVFAELSWE